MHRVNVLCCCCTSHTRNMLLLQDTADREGCIQGFGECQGQGRLNGPPMHLDYQKKQANAAHTPGSNGALAAG